MKTVDTGRVVHLELHTRALEDARRFYAGLCGWRHERVETAAGAYLTLEIGGAVGGGIVECPTSRTLWLPYVAVEDIRETVDRARLLGAEVMLEPREGPAGWRSVVRTEAGGEIAFWQAKR